MEKENDFQQKLLDKVIDVSNSYKQIESNKIIQIFHVVVLIIIALLTQKTSLTANIYFFLLFSFINIALSYFFFYLTDIYLINNSVITYIKESTNCLLSEKNNVTLKQDRKLAEASIKLNNNSNMCRNFCLFCTILSYLSLFVAVFLAYDISNCNNWLFILFFIPLICFCIAIYYYSQNK